MLILGCSQLQKRIGQAQPQKQILQHDEARPHGLSLPLGFTEKGSGFPGLLALSLQDAETSTSLC